MQRKFVLTVENTAGSRSSIIVDTPMMQQALGQYFEQVSKTLPVFSKDCGLPEIVKAELTPIWYQSVYNVEDKN